MFLPYVGTISSDNSWKWMTKNHVWIMFLICDIRDTKSVNFQLQICCKIKYNVTFTLLHMYFIIRSYYSLHM
jgi:hypothetical protein